MLWSLLALLLVAFNASAAERPTSVAILGDRYAVEYPAHIKDTVGKQRSLIGLTIYDEKKIQIAVESHGGQPLPERTIIETLAHEILHVINQKQKVFGETEDDHDRLDKTAVALIQVLIENGWLK